MFCSSSTPRGVVTASRKSFIVLPRPQCDLTNSRSHRLAPKYEELAALYGGDLKEKVTVAKVDATANDVPDSITGFPTIKLYPAGGKDSPVEYGGSRTVEDLVSFIKENGKYKVDGLAEGAKKAPEGGDVTSPPAASEAAETPAPSSETETHDEL